MKFIILAGVALAIFFAISYGFSQIERQECAQWQAQFNSATMSQRVEMLKEWQEWQTEQCGQVL